MRAVAYVRVSDPTQIDTWSIPAQKREFEAYCAAKGWQPVGIYPEEGISARSDSIEKRAALRSLLQDAASGAFDVIIVHSLDRWSRNLKVTLETFKSLAEHRIAFVSITENIDYSTPEGRLFVAMIGAFAQYFSDSLAKHVSKGKKERALQGLYNGDLAFGYERCECCPARVHPHPEEAPAVKELFARYATGRTTLSQLAGWMNGQGFRTHNKRRLKNAQGDTISGPQMFTLYSVRWILHNTFFTGVVRQGDQVLSGLHEPLVTPDLFGQVQEKLKASRGRASASPAFRSYLLKGLIRCVHCGLSLWAETATTGKAYYREKKGARARTRCPADGKGILASTLDTQVNWLIQGIQLQPSWQDYVLACITTLEDRVNVLEERQRLEDKLRRLGRAYVDGLMDEDEYQIQQRQLRSHLEALVVPEVEASLDAGKLLSNLGVLWDKATLEEQHQLLAGMIEAVYVDLASERRVVGIRPRPPFRPVFESTQASPEARAHLVGLVETGEN